MLESEGLEALTLRRLGTDLGSNHTAALRYFAGKDDLLLGLAERLIAEAVDGFEPGPGWRATLTALARRVRRACLAHPAVAVLVASRVSRRDAEFRGADLVIGALLEAGFGAQESAHYYWALVDVTLTMSSFEAASAVPGRRAAGGRPDGLAARVPGPPALPSTRTGHTVFGAGRRGRSVRDRDGAAAGRGGRALRPLVAGLPEPARHRHRRHRLDHGGRREHRAAQRRAARNRWP
ncbi:TetR/AcrR family transcriptional regulator C-terminal domain-containing protein [Kitasatospora sp. NBC_01287]|uniref:TetR/AcrR family transcriptional regulator n=1 Tax=Kitasatospora sp. NBC_01287 TaxID=2903573 RepID=UPI002259A675|nr:TetR/AcrR family transcriptional regulator C-terminal domain-containing protein [Kitasatospora sp. NBC_01287]MCX4751252.1 TetR/AcrR family transcriptional regulator C-terminal domain-containing protein [Kitasatospora sp. NBC_01287]